MRLSVCFLSLTGLSVAGPPARPRQHTLIERSRLAARRISLGTWQYNDTVAADAIAKGLKAGFTHIVRLHAA